MTRKIIITGMLFIGGMVSLSSCNEQEKHGVVEVSDLSPVTVSLSPVGRETAQSRVEVVGTVEAVKRASISARIAGQIIELPVVLGSEVNEGDLLVKISAGEISAKLLQAEAQLSQAQRNLEREVNLQKQGASTKETVKNLKNGVAIAEAAFKEARTMLDYTTIKAPFTGTITKKVANIGDLASPGNLLLQMENGDDLQVLAQVPEGLFLKVRKGDILPINIPAANKFLSGEVAEVAPAADPVSRTAPVKINIPSGPDLRVGQFARIGLNGTDEKTLMVPESAVLKRGQMNLAFTVVKGEKTARMRIVKTGKKYDNKVEILGGLEEGETVVVSNLNSLHDGQPVTIE